MGQRSQIILVTPAVNYGNKNPNDNKGRIFEFHNQWRYGRNAIIVLSDVLLKLKYLIEREKEKSEDGDYNYFIGRLDEHLNSAIRYAENHRIDWEMSKTHPGVEITEDLKKSKEEPLKFLEIITDNNNGWFLIKIDKNLEISVSILNGYEDGETIKELTPEEYINLFNEPEGTREYEFILEQALTHLKTIKKTTFFKEITNLKKKLVKEVEK